MSNIMWDFTENHVNIEVLKEVIKDVAIRHSQIISKEAKNDSISKNEFDIVKITKLVIPLEQVMPLDQTTVNEVIKSLEYSVRSIMDSNILVKDDDIKELVPLPHEILSLIFNSTSEKFRQQFFAELIEYYYEELSENMKKISASTVFEKDNLERQVKVLLPIIKLKAANKLLQNTDLQSQTLLKEIISDIILFFKYPRLNREDIILTVGNKLSSKNYKLLSYELIPLKEQNGLLGEYFRLKISVNFENREKTLNLFAKFLTQQENIRQEINGMSKKEKFFHMTYLPLLEEYGLQDLLEFTPKCYFYRLNDVIVLDDVASLGFTTLAPNIKLECDSLVSVIKQIAKLHASSMILEEMLSKKAKKTITLHDLYKDYISEIMFVRTNKIMKYSFDSFLEKLLYLVKKFPDITKNIGADELNSAITRSWEIIFERIKKSDKFKNTICHGDMYVGNMLFKFDTEKKCQDATLVDWQTYRYCPPVHDLLLVIHQNSLKVVRDKHYRQLLDTYYMELSIHFQHFNIDIDTIYSKEEFEESITYMKPQAVYRALIYSLFNAVDPRVREKLFESEEMKIHLRTDPRAFIDIGMKDDKYRQALGGLIQDLVELYKSGSF